MRLKSERSSVGFNTRPPLRGTSRMNSASVLPATYVVVPPKPGSLRRVARLVMRQGWTHLLAVLMWGAVYVACGSVVWGSNFHFTCISSYLYQRQPKGELSEKRKIVSCCNCLCYSAFNVSNYQP